VYRGPSLSTSMSHYLVERVEAAPNVEVRLSSEVTAVRGAGSLETVDVIDTASGARDVLPAAAMFIFIGASPNTAWLDGVVARDDRGFIMAGPDLGAEGLRPPWPLERDPLPLESSLPGVFVAGDVRHQSIKRVAAAVGDGAMAVQLVHHYLGTLA
jgi:thioredoxin reductase (NADPH)